MLFCASDESQRFSPDCFHQETAQLFRTELHPRSELCDRFLCRSSECAFHRWFEIRHGCHRLEDEEPFAPLGVASWEGWTLVHHARIHLPCACHCRLNSCSLGFPLPVSELLRAVGALSPVPGPTAPPMPCSISTTIQHNRSATMLQCMDLTKSFLDSS